MSAAPTRPDPVVASLTDLERMFTHGRWLAGRRHVAGSWCLIGGIDAATSQEGREVRHELTRALGASLPLPLRWFAALAPRTTLIVYNDYFGRQRGVLRLLRTTLARLTDGDAPATELRTMLVETGHDGRREPPPVRTSGLRWH